MKNDIEWEEVYVIETDVDGHGTRIVALEGVDKDGKVWEATGLMMYPYEDGFEEVEDVELKEGSRYNKPEKRENSND